MNDIDLKALLEKLSTGAVSPDRVLELLKQGPMRDGDLGFANVDHHRGLRHGLGEVIYGESKSADQIVAIAQELFAAGRPILATRLNPEKRATLKAAFPGGRENHEARTFLIHGSAAKTKASAEPFVAIVAAGTSDIAVAEEAAEVCVAMEVAHEKITDVGVAGIHRLFQKMPLIQKASVVIVLAGMEGALPSVLGGLVAVPLIAVPVSVGYGTSFNGLTALLSMLNSCAPGVTVVNIDNGFGAGFAAAKIIRGIKLGMAQGIAKS